MKNYFILYLGVAALLTGCSGNTKQPSVPANNSKNTVTDVHSYAKPALARTTHLDLDLRVDFEKHIINGVATYRITKTNDARELLLDTRNLEIQAVEDQAGKPLLFTLSEPDSVLGSALHIPLHNHTNRIKIRYKTTAKSDALQWLSPSQTAGKKQPFLFTQSQAILARTWLPCQDSPGIRFTYSANVTVPAALMAVMSASNPQQKNTTGKYTFVMDKPIPAYLMALSVGDLAFAPISNRAGIYAEPVTLPKAVNEFADLEKMIAAAEQLYGNYAWGRYDLLVLPPSFPFGGMENPKLTFVTPTVLAGDRSLTSLIAHELAHSWSGNLVTNATWNDFWLNEGFTVYFERRIMEQLYGKSYADMLQTLGYQDLQNTLQELGPNSPDTRLKLDLKGRNPDDGLTDIAYEKGNLLLVALEQAAGRSAFDKFLKNYFSKHAFGSITTAEFVTEVKNNLFAESEAIANKVPIEKWIYEPGLPVNHPVPASARFAAVDQELQKLTAGMSPAMLNTQNWSSHEWLHFIRHLPTSVTVKQMHQLDEAFKFTDTGNSEMLSAWLLLVVNHAYQPGYPALERFLINTGRRKFLTPLYTALLLTTNGKQKALHIYRQARPNYHAVTRITLDNLLGYRLDSVHN